MYLIAGLGNPGREYENTRHNMGYMALDLLEDRHHIDVRRHNFSGVFGEGFIGCEKVILVKPETFMNLSGRCIRAFVDYYKCEMQNLIVMYDDADLPEGDIRVREKGSAGSHNGMKSIIYELCRDDFPRVRIGIGKAEHGDMVNHVLTAPKGEAVELLREALSAAADAAELIAMGKADEAQAKFNKKITPPEENSGDEQ